MNLKGYTSTQAAELLKKYGENTLVERKGRSFFAIFFDQINNFLVILLLAAAGVSFIVGERFDATLILSIVILNAIFGIYQERKASDAIAALKKMTIVKVRVLRDGQEVEIDSRYIIPGDIFFIEEGAKIPADGKIIDAINLEINESALTGESMAITKEKGDEVYMGTIVAKGRGHAEVIATGMSTQFGKIAGHLSEIEEVKTPLQKKLEGTSTLIGFVGIVISLVVFFLSTWQGSTYFAAFLLAISLAVAVVPEGLPAIMTITLAMGVNEMAKRKAIMRKLSAIEALGSITLIATDKTGTLTENKMNVRKVYIGNKEYEEDTLPTLMNTVFHKLILNGVLCSTASLVRVHDHGETDVLGDPTEGALLFLAQKVGMDVEMTRDQWTLLEEEPFNSTTKTMSVLVKSHDKRMEFTKGALESVLQHVGYVSVGDSVNPLNNQGKEAIESQAELWARKGLRVLAFSSKEGDDKNVFLGMVGIHDPPRKETRDALRRAKKAGIKVVMITGDNERTAEAIGVTTGLMEEGDEILTGKQLEEYSDEVLLKKLLNVRIFARTTPFHKSRIVKLYQQLGEIVAVTGDGVNDAIALKQADVGVAMGKVGTDVARETADMVITDDNFSTIVNAVEEGRSIVRNLSNAVKYLLTGNLAEALSLVIGLLLGIPQLFYPIQILYTNLLSDGIPALAVAFSPREEGIMNRPPKKTSELLSVFDKRYIGVVGILGSLLVILCYYLFSIYGHQIGRTAAFCMLVCMQSFLFIDIWLDHRSMRKHLIRNVSQVFFVAFFITFGLQFIVVSFPSIAHVFKVVTIPAWMFGLVLILASSILVVIKLSKMVIRIGIR